ncbi:MAG: TetR/AcrR family transcriptional regulator [Acidimicrobiales bacterium]
MSPRPLTRQESQARTRARLVRSAERVFLKRGYLAASIGQIARAAGYTTGAVYSNFASKEELGLAVMEERLTETIASLQDALAAVEPTVQARLAALDAWSTRVLADEQWIVLTTEFAVAVRYKPPIRARFAAGMRTARDLIADVARQQHHELGLALPMPPERLATAVLALTIGLSVQRVTDPDLDRGIFADSIGALFASAPVAAAAATGN